MEIYSNLVEVLSNSQQFSAIYGFLLILLILLNQISYIYLYTSIYRAKMCVKTISDV